MSNKKRKSDNMSSDKDKVAVVVVPRLQRPLTMAKAMLAGMPDNATVHSEEVKPFLAAFAFVDRLLRQKQKLLMPNQLQGERVINLSQQPDLLAVSMLEAMGALPHSYSPPPPHSTLVPK